jgi:cytochrome c peroxidase
MYRWWPLWIAFALGGQTLSVPLGLDAYVPAPADNPIAVERARLGRQLFFDKRLSRDGTVACSSCHDPEHAFADPRPVAIGIQGKRGTRRTPRLANRAYGRSFFWDGRAATLEDQVGGPIENPLEMNLPVDEAAARVGLSEGELRRALATYVRTILSGDSPYDRYLAGDREALSALARDGLRLFRGKAGCVSCHLGTNLTDERFHNTGLNSADEGRHAVTRQPADRGAFKTPGLRDVARAAPYMHDGSLATLDDVIEHYDRGGRQRDNLDREIRPLELTPDEKRALKAFLESLTGRIREGL